MIRPRYYVYLLGFALLPHLLEIQLWVWLCSALIVGWALWADYHPEHKPSKLIVNTLSLIFPGLIYLEFKTLLGPDAATSLLLLMIALKLFEVYTYRDSIIILCLTLLLAMYHLVFRQDLYTTLYMLVVMFWTFYLLLKLNRPNASPNIKQWKVTGLLGVETLFSIPILLALFFLFPRFSSPLGRFIEPPKDKTGFSENLRPGDMADMANSDEVAFRVEFKTGEHPTNDQLYFRGQTLEVTDGINWLKSSVRDKINMPKYDKNQKGQHYRITFEPRFEKMIFSLDPSSTFQLSNIFRAHHFNNGTLLSERENQQMFQLRATRSTTALRNYPNDENLTKLPAKIYEYNPRLKELVENINSENQASHEKLALKNFFKTAELTYSLETPQYENLDQLLFGQKLGFCEHFASAAAIILRGLGLPSRVVVGFQGGEWNQYGNYLIIRDRHAHAWVEFYSERGQWERYDPTSDVSGYRISQGVTLSDLKERETANPTISAIAKELWNIMDNLNNQFALALLNLDKEAQLDWLRKLGFQNPDKKTIVKVFGSILIGFIFILFTVLWLRQPKVNAYQKLHNRLNEKLLSLNIGYHESLGPIETIELLKKNKLDEKYLEKIVKDFADLRYAQNSHSTLNQIMKDLDRI